MGPTQETNLSVKVEAPARVHLGFMDLNAGLGRRFGSLGLTVDGVSTRLTMARARRMSAAGPSAERALGCAYRLLRHFQLDGAVHVSLDSVIPEHMGLGSGTQLSLAVGTALDRLYGLGLETREIAAALARGMRSGIGIGAFDTGGFLVDGGRGHADDPPPVTVRVNFPEPWRILLILDARRRGTHGAQETLAFQQLSPFPADRAAHLCRLVLMRILPALIEARLEPFGRGIGELQRIVGDHFAHTQGGRFASPAVAQVLAWLESQGIRGVGQSSWGPTGFAVIDSESRATKLVAEAKARFGELTPLRYRVVRPRNRGSLVELRDAENRLIERYGNNASG